MDNLDISNSRPVGLNNLWPELKLELCEYLDLPRIMALRKSCSGFGEITRQYICQKRVFARLQDPRDRSMNPGYHFLRASELPPKGTKLRLFVTEEVAQWLSRKEAYSTPVDGKGEQLWPKFASKMKKIDVFYERAREVPPQPGLSEMLSGAKDLETLRVVKQHRLLNPQSRHARIPRFVPLSVPCLGEYYWPKLTRLTIDHDNSKESDMLLRRLLQAHAKTLRNLTLSIETRLVWDILGRALSYLELLDKVERFALSLIHDPHDWTGDTTEVDNLMYTVPGALCFSWPGSLHTELIWMKEK